VGKRNYNRLTLKKSTVSLAALLIAAGVLTACSHHIDLTRPKTQDNVGVEMARMNLWREAMFRFRRAVQIDPQDAMAHNNLAVAYEANGDFEAAAKEYREALRIDRSNTYIQKNYSRFTEFMARSKKRPKGSAPATAAATATAGSAVSTVANSPAGGTSSTAAPAATPATAAPAGAPPARPLAPPPSVPPPASAPPPPAPVPNPPGGVV
jgi:tetratricopeptide (TPR) repeat protein